MIFLILALLPIILYFVWDYYHHRDLLPSPKDRCVFITGCSSGFGRALALKLDAMGCYVFAGLHPWNVIYK